MPTVTCPYCQLQSLSKFAHKEHLRVSHAALFNKNIRTSITGASCELVAEPPVQPPTQSSPSSPVPNLPLAGTVGTQTETVAADVTVIVDEIVGAAFEDQYLFMRIRVGDASFRLRFDRSYFETA